MNAELTAHYEALGHSRPAIDLIEAIQNHPKTTPAGKAGAEKNLDILVEINNFITLEKSLSAHPKPLVVEIRFGDPAQAAQAQGAPPLPPVPSNAEFSDAIPSGSKRSGRFEVKNPSRGVVL